MKIQSSFKEYEVQFERDFTFFKQYFEEKDVFWIVDRIVYNLYKDALFKEIKTEKLILIDALETDKNIQTVLDICEEMTKLEAKRNIHLISVGGGIVQDITGLVANLLYRGIRWTFIPTTLLAACDSCIGGKTSLNYKQFKNLLGTFYPPDKILICPLFLKTLTERDYQSGLGEVVKFNIMYGEQGLNRIEKDIDTLLTRDDEVVLKYIKTSLEFKKNYIEKDEFDKGIRIHLNFAHTFGHALESVTKYAIPHGTAVAMGTLIANYISCKRGYLPKEIMCRVENLMLKIIHIDYDFCNIGMDEVITAIRKDKKQTDSNIRGVLFHQNMELEIHEDMKREEIEEAFLHLQNLLKEREKAYE